MRQPACQGREPGRLSDRHGARRHPITFASVARTAGVSNWLVYADGVREYIENARNAQEDQIVRDERVGRIASDASLRTDL